MTDTIVGILTVDTCCLLMPDVDSRLMMPPFCLLLSAIDDMIPCPFTMPL